MPIESKRKLVKKNAYESPYKRHAEQMAANSDKAKKLTFAQIKARNEAKRQREGQK